MPRIILIVDDSESGLATLELALMPIPDVSIQAAGSGGEALKILEKGEAFHALVTDLDLPRMDGFELIERVRAMPRFVDLPIIVISGDCDPHTPDRLRRLGANFHVVKPYSPAEVRQILEQFLNARL
jgi:two-component system chemotaxis response regulator CheY